MGKKRENYVKPKTHHANFLCISIFYKMKMKQKMKTKTKTEI